MRGIIGVTLSLALLLTFVVAAPVKAGATTEKYPISGSYPVPCANGGAGELVDYEGVAHYVETYVQRGYHQHRLFSVSNLFATGRTTGDTYRGRYILQSARNTHGGGEKGLNSRDIEKIAWTATGSSGVTYWHFFTVHRTVNANGERVVYQVDFSIGCE